MKCYILNAEIQDRLKNFAVLTAKELLEVHELVGSDDSGFSKKSEKKEMNDDKRQ